MASPSVWRPCPPRHNADIQKPTGEVPGARERATLLAPARQRGTFLVEDSPSREIRFLDRDLAPALLEMDCGLASPDTGRTLFVGLFSKIIAPGLRTGWAIGPAKVISIARKREAISAANHSHGIGLATRSG